MNKGKSIGFLLEYLYVNAKTQCCLWLSLCFYQICCSHRILIDYFIFTFPQLNNVFLCFHQVK